MNTYSDEVGFSLKSIKNSIKKLAGKKGKKKVSKPKLITSDAQGGVQQRIPLGFPQLTFSGTSATSQTATVNPQKPFMPRRLIVNAVATAGAVGQISLASFIIATEDMLAGAGPIPVQAFAANATDMTLMTRSARPGINITLRFEWVGTFAAPADNVVVSSVLIGDAVSQ